MGVVINISLARYLMQEQRKQWQNDWPSLFFCCPNRQRSRTSAGNRNADGWKFAAKNSKNSQECHASYDTAPALHTL